MFHRPPKTIQDILEKGNLAKLNQQQQVIKTLQEHWNQAVSAEVAKNSRCLTLNQGTLIIQVANAAWATRINFTKPHIMQYFQQLPDFPVNHIEIRINPTDFYLK